MLLELERLHAHYFLWEIYDIHLETACFYHAFSQSKQLINSEPIRVTYHECLKSKSHWIIFNSFNFDNPSKNRLLYRREPEHIIISKRRQTQTASTTGKVQVKEMTFLS